MKAVIQRVNFASVTVNDQIISSIGKGLCVLVGIGKDDSAEDLDYIAKKVINSRLFDDPENQRRWNLSVKDANLEVLSISQFTLYAVYKGNKLDFHNALGPESAKELYDKFIAKLGQLYEPNKIKDGKFGEYMGVKLENDGPVTVIIDSKSRN